MSGKFRIRDFVVSSVYEELLEMSNSADGWKAKPGTKPNWFSLSNTMAILKEFETLRVHGDGRVGEGELLLFAGESMFSSAGRKLKLTKTFVRRLFEEYIVTLPQAEMDLSHFVDLYIALENKDSTVSLEYFFPILDIAKIGRLTRTSIGIFFRDVVQVMRDAGAPGFDNKLIHDVTDEIFDMIRPIDATSITLEDVKRSALGGTVTSMLIDVNGFWHHENRESLS